MDTIYAEATPPGRGGVSIVRLSGPEAREIGESLAGPLPCPREAYLRPVRDGEHIDTGLVMRFDTGMSFTGESVVEFHLHGAPVVVRRLERALRQRGARLANAGEFTRRAFLNGVITLSAAEAMSDLLVAETEAQRVQAMRLVSGDLIRWADELRGKLVRAGALIEASLDFADEDVPDDVPVEAVTLIAETRAAIEAEIGGYPAAERVRSGFELAIVGPPNAGKSSLLNWIARRDVALVSEQAGTTRDVLELRVDLGGLAVTFLDTAGLREAADEIERLGVARGRCRAESADLRVHLSTDGSVDAGLWREGDIVVRSKADLGRGDLSSVTGHGIEALLDRVKAVLQRRVAGAGLLSRSRQVQAMEDAVRALAMPDCLPAEIMAEQLRQAAARLSELVGRIAPDDYLDEIFSTFCIGK